MREHSANSAESEYVRILWACTFTDNFTAKYTENLAHAHAVDTGPSLCIIEGLRTRLTRMHLRVPIFPNIFWGGGGHAPRPTYIELLTRQNWASSNIGTPLFKFLNPPLPCNPAPNHTLQQLCQLSQPQSFAPSLLSLFGSTINCVINVNFGQYSTSVKFHGKEKFSYPLPEEWIRLYQALSSIFDSVYLCAYIPGA